MGSGYSKMKKQAQMMKDQMQKIQTELKDKSYVGSAPNNLVTLTLTGEKQLKKIKIDPKCVDSNDVEGLEDLITAAFEDAYQKVDVEDNNNLDINGLLGF